MTKERFDKAKLLKLVITAGIGSDHTDLQAAMDQGVTVAEVSVSAYVGTVSAYACSASADAGHLSDLKPKRSSLSHARGQGEYRPVARATGAKKKPRRNVGAQVLPKLIGRA